MQDDPYFKAAAGCFVLARNYLRKPTLGDISLDVREHYQAVCEIVVFLLHLSDRLIFEAVGKFLRGEHLHMMSAEQGTNLKLWDAHPDAERLGFVRARHHTPVIVGQDNNRLAFQDRVKDPLTGGVEIIAIDEGKDGRHETTQSA